MPPFSIASCTVTDGPALAQNNICAFWEDQVWRLVWPGKTCDYVVSQAKIRMPYALLMDPTLRRHQKAIDSHTGEIVGYARWILPESVPEGGKPDELWLDAKVERVGEEREVELKKAYDDADWDYDHTLDELDVKVMGIKERLMAKKPYLVLDYLAVHPDHAGQGIGLTLVEGGVTAAESMGLDCFVVAMKAGLRIYQGAGFKLVEECIQSAVKFGVQDDYSMFFLLKECAKQKEGDRLDRV